jgi:hypothetical protein
MADEREAVRATLEELNLSIPQWEQIRDDRAKECLDRVLSDRLAFRRADGTLVGKAEFMAALDDPGPFVSRESSQLAVDVVGDRAISISMVSGTTTAGQLKYFLNVRFLTIAEGRWRVDSWFNTEVP